MSRSENLAYVYQSMQNTLLESESGRRQRAEIRAMAYTYALLVCMEDCMEARIVKKVSPLINSPYGEDPVFHHFLLELCSPAWVERRGNLDKKKQLREIEILERKADALLAMHEASIAGGE